MTCKECGFGQARGDEFCSDICKLFWSRRTTDPMFWSNLPREPKTAVMSEETKAKLREYNDKKKAAKVAEEAAFQADEISAAQEVL